MGKAKKRFYKLYSKLRKQYPDAELGALYNRAIDIDQREQARLQGERWRKEWREREQRDLR